MNSDIKNLSSFVWSIAETLRGDFKQSEYDKVILPFVVLRRLDCILRRSKSAVRGVAAAEPLDAMIEWAHPKRKLIQKAQRV